MTVRISVGVVRDIYRDQVAAGRIRDPGLLEAAVEAPFQHVFDRELYPTVALKAVKLLEGISRAQAYTDGNKRLAWLSMTTLLQLNGLDLEGVSQTEGARFTLQLDGSPEGLIEAALWVSDRLTNLA